MSRVSEGNYHLFLGVDFSILHLFWLLHEKYNITLCISGSVPCLWLMGASIIWNWSQFFASHHLGPSRDSKLCWAQGQQPKHSTETTTTSVKTSHTNFGMQMGETWQKYNSYSIYTADWTFNSTIKGNQIRDNATSGTILSRCLCFLYFADLRGFRYIHSSWELHDNKRSIN